MVERTQINAKNTRAAAVTIDHLPKPAVRQAESILSSLLPVAPPKKATAYAVNITIIPWPRPEKVLAIVETRFLSFSSLANDGIIDQNGMSARVLVMPQNT